jgi:hypothetical protein
MKQGESANRHGQELEKFIRNAIEGKGYTYVDKAFFKAACCLDQAIYSSQLIIGNSIYDNILKCDFILRHPMKFPDCLVIEAKWQETGGSTDEKFPYLVLNIKEKSPYPTIIVLDGGGFKPGSEQWLRGQVGGNLLQVFNMMEFQRWSNRDAL